jgi:hypothetical protein
MGLYGAGLDERARKSVDLSLDLAAAEQGCRGPSATVVVSVMVVLSTMAVVLSSVMVVVAVSAMVVLSSAM